MVNCVIGVKVQLSYWRHRTNRIILLKIGDLRGVIQSKPIKFSRNVSSSEGPTNPKDNLFFFWSGSHNIWMFSLRKKYLDVCIPHNVIYIRAQIFGKILRNKYLDKCIPHNVIYIRAHLGDSAGWWGHFGASICQYICPHEA